jgi:hypothetical protein
MAERVSNEPLRERFRQLQRVYGISASDICKEMGWTRADHGPDTSRLMRTLGLSPHYGTKRASNRLQAFCSYDQAVRLCRALDMDPFEAGV